MDKHKALKSYRAKCAWNMNFPGSPSGPGSVRKIVYTSPNKFKIVSTMGNGFVQCAVSDGVHLTDVSNQKELGAMKYGAPSSISTAGSMYMQHPMFCGSLLYQFFGGRDHFGNLVQASKGSVKFGKALTLDGHPCKLVSFYATGNYGHMDVAIATDDGLVRRISYDSEPLMKMVAGQLPKGQKGTQSSTESYSKIQVNQTVNASEFTTAIPKGTKTMEMGRSAENTPPVPIGKPAPDFEVASLAGKPVRLSSLKGKVVLLDFWATWCPPCRKGLPETLKFHKELAGKGLSVLAISDEKKGTVEEFVKKNHPGLPTYLDNGGKLNKAYKIEAIPTVAIIDKSGRLSSWFVGLQSSDTIRAALKKAGL